MTCGQLQPVEVEAIISGIEWFLCGSSETVAVNFIITFPSFQIGAKGEKSTHKGWKFIIMPSETLKMRHNECNGTTRNQFYAMQSFWQMKFRWKKCRCIKKSWGSLWTKWQVFFCNFCSNLLKFESSTLTFLSIVKTRLCDVGRFADFVTSVVNHNWI